MSPFLALPANHRGRDFVVGDVHGCFATLSRLLKLTGFNPADDRLLSVGDLVDRGPSSASVLEWLSQPWFFAVRGNHEQLALDYDGSAEKRTRYQRNGGNWFLALDDYDKLRYCDAFAALPLAIQLNVADRLIGIVHADCPNDDWNSLQVLLASGETTRCDNGHSARRQTIWCRERIQGENRKQVAGLDLLCVGHSPVEEARQLDNVLYLDTGVALGKKMTLLCLNDMKITVCECKEMSPAAAEQPPATSRPPSALQRLRTLFGVS